MDWRSVRTSFLERRIHLMENDLWTDCIFSLGPDRVYFTSHKLLLAMASPVFEALFFQSNQRIDYPIHFEDQDPGAFKKLLQYIYSENVVMENYTEAREVHRTSMKFAMTDLEKQCLRRIKETVTFETACDLLEYSESVEQLYGNQAGKPLADRALEIIIRETPQVLRQPSFNAIKLTTLETILRIDELNVSSEIELADALLNWARENSPAEPLTTESLRAVAAPAMRHLRVLTLTSQQVVESLAETPLMTNDECLAVLKLVAVAPPGRVTEPAVFSTCRRRRGPNVRGGHELCPPRNPLCGTPRR